jgi:hypothetical protein
MRSWAPAEPSGWGWRPIETGRSPCKRPATTRGLQLVATAVTDPCAYGAYNLSGVKWGANFAWSYQSATTPSNLTASAAAGALQRAVNHVTGGYNNCGLGDNVAPRTRTAEARQSRRTSPPVLAAELRTRRTWLGSGRPPAAIWA